MATLRLGALTENLHGRAGNTVFVRTAAGVSVRDYVIPRRNDTPGQAAGRERLRQAIAAWHSLSFEQAEAWRAYAQSLGVRQPGTGMVRAPRPMNVFNGLACKLRQAVPEAEIPLWPPSGPFFGDGIGLAVGVGALGRYGSGDGRAGVAVLGCCGVAGRNGEAASPSSADGRGDEEGAGGGDGSGTRFGPMPPHPSSLRSQALSLQGRGEIAESPTPSPSLITKNGDEGGEIRFTASAPNSPGVLTELLLQPLNSFATKPQPRLYRSKAFVAFTSAALEASLPVPPGIYAAAYRFVNAATGQDTPLAELGLMSV